MIGYLAGLGLAAYAAYHWEDMCGATKEHLNNMFGTTEDNEAEAQDNGQRTAYENNRRFVPPAAASRDARKPYGNFTRSRNIPAPEEKDHNLRVFEVPGPEGEVYTIDTADESSPFYGPVWTRVFDAYETGEFLRGRASLRVSSKDEGRFSGYAVSIGGLNAFLPKSKSSFFYEPERDATNKCLALKVETIHTNGDYKGNIIVSAKEPWEKTLGQFRDIPPGKEMYALAEDYENGELIFPGFFKPGEFGESAQWQTISVPLDQALRIGGRYGISDVNFLTGLYWRLRIAGSIDGEQWIAEPIEVLV
ncbi:hypothetical protein FACS1894167_04970 [Synergistales bacterium]|nr:hypothetical protein FACS1894167_04970 [Synergistales bacterium]